MGLYKSSTTSNTESHPIMPSLEDAYSYPGSGTLADPYIVDWVPSDPDDPYNWSNTLKWTITAQLALCTWTVSFSSSAYAGGIDATISDLHISYNVAILGISLYVLGFALGPLLFASMGEMYGRRIIFLITLSLYTVFQLQGALGGSNLANLLSCRLLTGIFGSSPLTNAGGTVSDIWSPRERGLASAIYATVPFLGPVIGPIVGGFVVENTHLGWRFNFWLMFIFSALSLVSGYLLVPETYAPVLLRRRAQELQAQLTNGNTIYYTSTYDKTTTSSRSKIFLTNLCRPFILLVTSPPLLLLSLYLSIIYGTLYALFSIFPLIFTLTRHFTPAQSGLAFLGLGVGILVGLGGQWVQDGVYARCVERARGEGKGKVGPEARLHMAILGAVLAPIGLWWFALSSPPPSHPLLPILSLIPFGAGISAILQSLTTYLMDAYTLSFASAIAASVVTRSLAAAAFPLVVPLLVGRLSGGGEAETALGMQRTMCVFAGLATVCAPIPFLFFKYGPYMRSKSRYAYQGDNIASTSLTSTDSESSISISISSEKHTTTKRLTSASQLISEEATVYEPERVFTHTTTSSTQSMVEVDIADSDINVRS